MNNDLIHRSAALAVLEELKNHVASPDPVGEVADAIETMRKVQAVDAEPVRHGRWIMRGGKFRCSECDAVALQKDEGGTGGFSHEYVYVKSNHCPNCGTKMDGDMSA